MVFWNIMRTETDEVNAAGRKVVKTIPLLRHYVVWNVEQSDGITMPEAPEPAEEPEFNSIEAADAVIDNMPNRAEMFYDGGDRAYYAPYDDSRDLPDREAFHRNTAFYSTAFHELAHSTGPREALGDVKSWTGFGSDPCAKEELVAELTSVMLCGVVGMHTTFEQPAAHIANWSERFQRGPKLIVAAAGAAQTPQISFLVRSWWQRMRVETRRLIEVGGRQVAREEGAYACTPAAKSRPRLARP
jgi:antirestriction protein ArdC